MKIKTLLLLFIYLIAFSSQTQNTKAEAILKFRNHFSKNSYRGYSLRIEESLNTCIDLLNNNGVFTDLKTEQEYFFKNNLLSSKKSPDQIKVATHITKAYNRLWKIAESYRGKTLDLNNLSSVQIKMMKGFVNYGNLELQRANAFRFHASCFAIPTAAINSYFALLDAMNKIEKNSTSNTLVFQTNKMLKKMGMQSWTHPLRNDKTDENVVQIERFRNHVWWVGGNALAYRPVFSAAVMMKSAKMIDVLATVSQKAISHVSQNTYNTAFWTEGFTADGAGWGHGKQSLVWGYPIDGTLSALLLLKNLKNSPWEEKLTIDNKAAIFNFLRGSSWYYYKGYDPLCLGRKNMEYVDEKKPAKSVSLINTLLSHFKSNLSTDEIDELTQLKKEISNYNIIMDSYKKGDYLGSRSFFNNDDLIQKTKNCYVLINMASERVDGNESALFHDRYNYYTNDGLTFFEKEGNEYHKAIGAWNLTAIPGVTNRQGEKQLKPTTNWRGFCSKHNFSGATTSGSKNAVAGFIYEKMNASAKKGVNDTDGLKNHNDFLYDVKAYKSYFFLGDYMLALGAGITNLKPDLEGDIWTTIDQTFWDNKINWGGTLKKGYFETASKLNTEILTNKNDKIIWVQQENRFAYGVYPKYTNGEVIVKAEVKKTKWEELNPLNKKKKNLPNQAPVFQLSINHKKDIENGMYAYFVHLENNFCKAKMKKPNIKIISNTTSLQAASTKNESTISGVFYDANTVLKTKKGAIKVSHPLVVMLEDNDTYWKISITDPKMDKNLKKVDVFTTIHIKGKQVKKTKDWYKIAVELPKGDLLGKPKTLYIEKI